MTGPSRLASCGWTVDGHGDPAALQAGGPVRLRSALTWPLPPLVDGDGPVVLVTDELAPAHDGLLLRPPSLVVGVGAVRGAPVHRVLAMIDTALAEAGLAAGSVRGLATSEVKAHDPSIREAARARGWTVTAHASATLAAVTVPHPSERVAAAVGTPSVAEAGALVGADAELVVPKRHDGAVTVAVARHPPRGLLAVVGPDGDPAEALHRCAVLVSRSATTPPTVRGARRTVTRDPVATAVARAREGHAVAVAGVDHADVVAALEAPGPGREVDLRTAWSDGPTGARRWR